MLHCEDIQNIEPFSKHLKDAATEFMLTTPGGK